MMPSRVPGVLLGGSDWLCLGYKPIFKLTVVCLRGGSDFGMERGSINLPVLLARTPSLDAAILLGGWQVLLLSSRSHLSLWES
jgi:hypothetical protein